MDLNEAAQQVDGWQALTPREDEVLRRLLQGKSNKDVGRDLHISARTIEVHRARAMEKFGATNALDLARLAHERDMQALRDMLRRLVEADDEHRGEVIAEARGMLGGQA